MIAKERPFSSLLFGSPSPAVNSTHIQKQITSKTQQKEWQKTDNFFYNSLRGGSDYIDSDSNKMPGSIVHDVAGKYNLDKTSSRKAGSNLRAIPSCFLLEGGR